MSKKQRILVCASLVALAFAPHFWFHWWGHKVTRGDQSTSVALEFSSSREENALPAELGRVHTYGVFYRDDVNRDAAFWLGELGPLLLLACATFIVLRGRKQAATSLAMEPAAKSDS